MKHQQVFIAERVAYLAATTGTTRVVYGRVHAGTVVIWSERPNAFLAPVGVISPGPLPQGRACQLPVVLIASAGPPTAYVQDANGEFVETRTTVVSTVRDLQRRNHGVLESNALQGVVVAAVGAGSIGSNVLRLLAQAGVGEVRIADAAVFSPGNACRHTLGLDAVGLQKSFALGDQLQLLNPDLEVRTLGVPLSTATFEQYKEFLIGSSLVLVSTDSISANLLAQDVCLEAGVIPSVFVGCWERAVGAEILLSDPAAGGACYGCMRGGLPSADADKGTIDYSSITAPTDPPQPGLGADVTFVSAIAAKVCLVQLTADWDSGLLQRDRSLLYVGTRAEDVFQQACQVSSIGTVADPDCWHCAYLQGTGVEHHDIRNSIAVGVARTGRVARRVQLDR